MYFVYFFEGIEDPSGDPTEMSLVVHYHMRPDRVTSLEVSGGRGHE